VRIDVFTIFPEFLEAPLSVSLLGKARDAGLVDVRLHDPRAFATDRHRSVDDTPFGGGAGMVMRPEPLVAAIEAAAPARPVLLLAAGGRRFDQACAAELASGNGFSLVCGRYEGVDERVAEVCCDGELSVGDFVRARAAGVPAVHAAAGVPGPRRARGAAVGRPRAHRPVASRPGVAPHARTPPRPARRP
jgi:tRNA (guanine37-N1)-methyltransferase